jgi:hypothetical protein
MSSCRKVLKLLLLFNPSVRKIFNDEINQVRLFYLPLAEKYTEEYLDYKFVSEIENVWPTNNSQKLAFFYRDFQSGSSYAFYSVKGPQFRYLLQNRTNFYVNSTFWDERTLYAKHPDIPLTFQIVNQNIIEHHQDLNLFTFHFHEEFVIDFKQSIKRLQEKISEQSVLVLNGRISAAKFEQRMFNMIISVGVSTRINLHKKHDNNLVLGKFRIRTGLFYQPWNPLLPVDLLDPIGYLFNYNTHVLMKLAVFLGTEKIFKSVQDSFGYVVEYGDIMNRASNYLLSFIRLPLEQEPQRYEKMMHKRIIEIAKHELVKSWFLAAPQMGFSRSTRRLYGLMIIDYIDEISHSILDRKERIQTLFRW